MLQRGTREPDGLSVSFFDIPSPEPTPETIFERFALKKKPQKTDTHLGDNMDRTQLLFAAWFCCRLLRSLRLGFNSTSVLENNNYI